MESFLSKLKTATYFSVVLNFILLVILAIVFFVKDNDTDLNNRPSLNVTGQDNKSVCFTCDYLGDDVKKDDTLFSDITKTKCGHRLCCIKQDGLHLFIKKMLLSSEEENKQNFDVIRQMKWWRERRNAAHLFREKTKNKQDLKWKEKDSNGIAFTNRIKFVNGTLEVDEPGLYFVYTAITVDFSAEHRVPIIYHNVTTKHPKLVENGQKLRLMNKYGGSVSSDKVYTSFLCGSLYVYRGFQIETQISDPVYIRDDSYSSYFGLFKL